MSISNSMCRVKLGRSLCDAIEGYIDPHEAAALEAAETSERSLLLAMAASLGARP